MTALVLASASPARLSLLHAAGITPEVMVSEIDEDALKDATTVPDVASLAALLGAAKGRDVAEAITRGTRTPSTDAEELVLVAADSLLELDGDPVGKPHTAQATRELWQHMGGRAATLHSGHWVALLRRNARGAWRLEDTAEAVGSTRITTAVPTPAELEAYIATGEPFHVAGGLTIDGYGAAFVTGISGDHTNVIGLSIPLLRELVTGLGVFWPNLWDARRKA